MSANKGHIDKLIKEKLLQAELSPPDAVWSGINTTLALKRKAKIVLFYKRVSYVAALLVFGFLGYYFLRSDSDIKSDVDSFSQEKISSNTVSNEGLIEKEPVELSLDHKREKPQQEANKTLVASREKSISNTLAQAREKKAIKHLKSWIGKI